MGHRLSKIVTRTGDAGTSGLADGERLPKTHPRFQAMGDVDELNALLGVLLAHHIAERFAAPLRPVQHQLFNLGGELAMPGQALIREDHVAALEQAVEPLNADLPPLKEFVLPTGPLPVVTTHHARAVCRRAERAVWAVMEEDDDASRLPAVYLNRLSDLLFVIARQLARAANPQEQTWQI